MGSNAILEAIEAGDHAETRSKLSHLEQFGYTNVILSPSMHMKHNLRTPLMAAAATGNLSIFETVLSAVKRAIKRLGADDTDNELLQQLVKTDLNERTLVMHAVRSGNAAILKAVLYLIVIFKEWELLLDKDYVGKTVLMHAASSGRTEVFKNLFSAIKENTKKNNFIAHILKTSDDGRTILMHAARCGNPRGLSAVALACKNNIKPSKMRELLEEVDGKEMTFLMHAASGRCEGTADDVEPEMKKKQKKIKEKKEQEKKKQKQWRAGGVNFTSSSPAVRRSSAPAGMLSIPESKGEDISEVDEHEEIKAATSGSAAPNAAAASPFEDEAAAMEAAAAEASRNDPGPDATPQRENTSATTSSEPRGGEGNQHTARRLGSKFKVLEKELSVFKVAWSLVKEMLWKEQVRDQLRARDSWGRTILAHAVISGRLQVFDATFYIVRENILDFEIEDLMGINKDDNEVTVMEASLSEASEDMVALVNRRDQELKKLVAIREKAATIEAKIQSFIPGKSIVIFQLLLPEMKDANAALILLIVMSALAPIFAFSGNLITKEAPSSRKSPMLSTASILLAAPAMWWWGIGTSSIAQDSFGWSETSSAASLAVATIVIPALDQFLGSHKMEHVYDTVCLQQRRFARKSEAEWEKQQREDEGNSEDDKDSWREGTTRQAESQRRDNQRVGYMPICLSSEEAKEADTAGESMA